MPALCYQWQGWSGSGTAPTARDAPPISPSPSFSSIFHSSCFLHKAGVSRDSSQMFSAAHHIAFLMKYSWSLSAFCHESLLQLPALETLRRQHSCKATHPGPPASRSAPLHHSSFLFLFAPSRLSDAAPPGATGRGRPHPAQGRILLRVGARGAEGCQPPRAKATLGMAVPGAAACRQDPGAAAGSQPARGIRDAVHYNPIRLFMQTIRFYVSVKSLNNLNQSERPEITAGGGWALRGWQAGHPAQLVTPCLDCDTLPSL